MKIIIGLLLVGLLAAANVQAQASIAELADVAAHKDLPVAPPTQKTTQRIIEAVGNVVASLTPGTPESTDTETPFEQPVEANEAAETQLHETDKLEEEINESVVPEASEAEEPAEPTEASETEEPTEEKPAQVIAPTKKELKAIAKYNEAVDQILTILGERVKEMEPFPLMLDVESLLALEASEPEPEVAHAETTLRKNKFKNKKNKKNKRKNQKRKTSLERTPGNTNSQEKGNKNKSPETNNNSNNNSGENKRKNKNKNRKNKNKKNKNKKNRDNVEGRRQPKASDDDDFMDDDDDLVVVGRRKNEKSHNRKNNNNDKNKNKKNKNRGNKKNKKNKNKKNKNNKGLLDMESRENAGPIIPTSVERAESNAKMTGFNNLQRIGDVTVDLSGRKQTVNTEFSIGPLEINLKDKTRSLTRASVTTNLTAAAVFKVKVVRGRSKITLSGLAVSDLQEDEVAVNRKDVVLDPEVVADAQKQVIQSVDIERIGRILSYELKNIFDKENVIENLGRHSFHKKN